MEKDTLSNYFDDLRFKAREIDKGTDKLTEIWKMPQLLVGGYGDCTAETNAYLEHMRDIVRSTADKVEKFQLELEPLEETDRFLKESRANYENLKEEYDNLAIVLAEYNCHYKEDSVEQGNQRDDSKDETNSTNLSNEKISDIEVEFTPNLTWKRTSKGSDGVVQKNSSIKGIATPVIKSLQSALQSETPHLKVPINSSMQESNLSKRLTRVLRK